VLGRGLRLAQLALAVAQGLFREGTSRGVEEHRVDAHDLAVLVDVRDVAARVPHRVAIAIRTSPLQRHRLAAQGGGELRLDALPHVGLDDVAQLHARDFGVGLAKPYLLRAVDVAVAKLASM
jgi:hypothetical protein